MSSKSSSRRNKPRATPSAADAQPKEQPSAQPRQTLEEAQRTTCKERWEGRRIYRSAISQSKDAIRWLKEKRGVVYLDEITKEMLTDYALEMKEAGLAHFTVRGRLYTLSAMGVDVKGCMPRFPRQPAKWWLQPRHRQRLLEWLRADEAEAGARPSEDPAASTASVPEGAAPQLAPARVPFTFPIQKNVPLPITVHANRARARKKRRLRLILADYIEWTALTGLRVEENLRLRGRHLIQREDGYELEVPGTKTELSHATLPISDEAAAVVLKHGLPDLDAPLFDISYRQLVKLWLDCRKFLGIPPEDTMATLKALRRTAARYLHADNGMPLDMVRQYLRHSNVETTMGYLKLVGGYNTAQLRKWLK